MCDVWSKKEKKMSHQVWQSGRTWKKRSYLACVSAHWKLGYMNSNFFFFFFCHFPPSLFSFFKESLTQNSWIKKWKQSRGLHLICPLKCGGLFKRRAGTRTDKGPFYRSLTPSHLIEFIPRYRNESEQIHTHELDASDQFCWSPPRRSELSWNLPPWQTVCTVPFSSASNYCTQGFK